ncbi:hypothetical protein KY290_004926 [Solanum tuberosum]|uniref:Uncharacterized protein n=1 Tax=Solanum tuberosum TaxID=4113 RepID=A0ABQ7WEF9_SOLTU|nr:hypothetical protein KY290_004926 [Solanum tuberosum]
MAYHHMLPRNLQDPPLIFTTTPMPPGNTPTSWLELALQEEQLSFQVVIAVQLMTLILQDPAYLAQIIKEGVDQGIAELGHQIWMQMLRQTQMWGSMNSMTMEELNELEEPINTTVIAYCPQGTTRYTLNLRNEKDLVPAAVALNPTGLPKQGSQLEKGKGLQEQATQLNPIMTFIIWNVRGSNSVSFRCQCGVMLKFHKPAMLVLLETKMIEHKSLTEELKFNSQIQAAANGLSGGIMIMWNEDTLKLEDLSITPQGIHVSIKVLPNSPSWFFSTVYASPNFNTRTDLWKELCSLSSTINGECLTGGEFNEVLHAREKLGGNNINHNRASLFWNCLNECKMIDLRFKGCKYTWTNKRYKNMSNLIFERLDRCVANDFWIKLFPNSVITHLPKTKSDQCPMLITLDNNNSKKVLNLSKWNPCGVGTHPSNPLSNTVLTTKTL